MKTDLLKVYAKKDLMQNKSKSLVVIITIFLGFTFLFTMNTYFFSSSALFKNKLENGHQASFVGVSPELVNGIKGEEDVLKAGLGYIFGEVHIKNAKVRVAYMDKELLEFAGMRNIEGNYPDKPDEIVLSKEYVEFLGGDFYIGQSINLNLGRGEKNYTISGFLNKESVSGIYIALVSKSYVDLYGQDDKYFMQVSMKDREAYSPDELKGTIKALGEKYNLEENQIHFFDTYFNYKSLLNASQYGVIAIVSFVLGIASYLIIHNIFYILALEDRKNMALIRLIGASKKQAVAIMNTKIRYLGMIGVGLGIVFSVSISFLSNRNGLMFLLLHNLFEIGIIFLICILYVYGVLHFSAFSIRREIKKISITELFRESESTSKGVKRNKNTFVSPKFLAWLNVKRDSKKTISIILSLSLGGILLVSSYTFLKSFDPDELARKEYPDYEYLISLEDDGIYDEAQHEGILRIQNNNPLNTRLIHSLREIENVDKIKIIKGSNIKFISPNNKSDSLDIQGYTADDEERLNHKLIEGVSSYRELLKENGVIINQAEEFKTYYDWEVKIGDDISLERNGKRIKMKVLGITDIVSDGVYFYIPEEALYKFGNPDANFNYKLQIELKDKSVVKQEEFRTIISRIISEYPLKMETYLEKVDAYEVSLNSSKKFALSITIMILIIGLANLINTYVTNILSRKSEISLLRLLAMKRSQLMEMLYAENYYYMKHILSFSLLGGGLVSLLVHHFLKNDIIIGGAKYSFPVLEFVVFALSIYLIGKLVVKVISKVMKV